MKTINIVIVDDDEDDYLIVDGYLKEISGVHFNTVWIPDFNLAVQAIKEQKADVYLVDYMMGEKTGLDVLAAVNTPLLQKPIILVTGHQDRNIDLQAMDMGAADFLYKRTLTSELLERSIRYSIKQSEDRMRLHEADQFEMQKKALETANEFKSRYVADICHEIRNPLGAIIGFADLAGDPGTNEEERVHFISTIQRNGEYLLGLLSDVLDLAKLEAGQVQIFVEKFKPMNVFSDVIDLMRVSARAKGLELDLIVENPSLEINSDQRRLKQILLNLVGNAIKFTAAGKITIECRIFKQDPKGNFLHVVVSDTGIGMSAEEAKHLFTAYQQGQTGLKQKIAGTGLGLNLSKKLAETLGGNLTLTSTNLGVGSTFTLALPITA